MQIDDTAKKDAPKEEHPWDAAEELAAAAAQKRGDLDEVADWLGTVHA